MGKIFVSWDNSEENIVVTRYESSGSIIPNSITQEKIIAIISDNLDEDKDEPKELNPDQKAVSRMDFLKKLLSTVDCKESFSIYGKGLYSKNDMEKGITFGEVAYLLYYVMGMNRCLDWNSIKPDGIGVCVLKEMSNGTSKLCEQLAKYKNKKEMEYYIKAMRCGERYIPLPMYCAYVDFISRDDVNLGLDTDMIFKRLSEADLQEIFG